MATTRSTSTPCAAGIRGSFGCTIAVGGDSDRAAEGVTAAGDVGIGGAAAVGATGIGVVPCAL